MAHGPRPRYDVLQPSTLPSGDFLWKRIGTGYRNPDNTIDAYLDVSITGHHFRLREALPSNPPANGPGERRVRTREVEDALATLLGSRRKRRALLGATSLRHLVQARPEELETWLPRRAARRFHAAVQLARFALSPEPNEVLDTPYAAFAHFHPYLALRETERMVVAALDGRFRVLATEIVAEGAANLVDVRMADLFAPAVRHRAVSLVAAHNHPSGDMTPSLEDYALTRRMTEAGRALGIQVVDHLIVVGDGFWTLLCGDRGTTAEAARREPSAY